ncbi:MAG: hypothetical protein M1315_04775 [Candidatus Thermoplasmatota archaeon]|nr:hypothetical protein [Candidatus Thermoplasmatota archaeon]
MCILDYCIYESRDTEGCKEDRRGERHSGGSEVHGGIPIIYRDTTRWDRERKKRIKVSEYIGRITEHGLVVNAGQDLCKIAGPYTSLGILNSCSQLLQI